MLDILLEKEPSYKEERGFCLKHKELLRNLYSCAEDLSPLIKQDIRTRFYQGKASWNWIKRTISNNPELQKSKLAELIDIGYIQFIPVRECKYIGMKETYDISVPKNNYYMSYGFISHNTIMFLMGTTNNGIEPPFALTSYKLMSDGSMVTLICNEAHDALRDLGYNESQVEDISEYINKKGNVEGAPHLNIQHYPIFDTANVNGNGKRFIRSMAHVEAIAAATPFISGGISKTINMPENATLQDIWNCYIEGWKMGCKSLALYRSGSKWSQPLNSRNKNLRKEAIKRESKRARLRIEQSDFHRENPNDIWEYRKGLAARKRAGGRAPSERLNFQIGGENIHFHPVRYPDNGISELWIEVGKENPTVNGLADAIGRIVSVAIQYGVPIEALADTMSNLQFDPAGFLGPNELEIHSAKSLADLTSKVLKKLTLEYEGEKHDNSTENEISITYNNEDSISSSEEAKSKGFSGTQCEECGSWKTNGTIKCGVCLACGSTYGSCS